MGITESTFVSNGFETCITCKPPSKATDKTTVKPGEMNELYKWDTKGNNNNNNNNNRDRISTKKKRKKRRKNKKHRKKHKRNKHKKNVGFDAPSLNIDVGDIYGDRVYPSTPNATNKFVKRTTNEELSLEVHSRSKSVPENIFGNPVDYHNFGPSIYTNPSNPNVTHHPYSNYASNNYTEFGFPTTYLNIQQQHQKKDSILDDANMVSLIEQLPLTPMDRELNAQREDHERQEVIAMTRQLSKLKSQKLRAINEQKSTQTYRDDDELSSYNGSGTTSVTSPNALMIMTPKLKTFSSAPEYGSTTSTNKPVYNKAKSENAYDIKKSTKHSKKIWFIKRNDINTKPKLQKQRSQSMDVVRTNQ